MDRILRLHDPDSCEQCQSLKRAVEAGDPMITCIHDHSPKGVCGLCLTDQPGGAGTGGSGTGSS